MRINVNLGTFMAEGCVFRPSPKSTWIEEPQKSSLFAEDYRKKLGKDVFSGLIIMGLTSQDESQTFSIDDVLPFVRDVRIEQAGDPGASFISQKGIYRHSESGKIVTEDSIRIVLLDITGETVDDFTENVLRLAELLRAKFDQETVIVEFQNRGVTQEVYEIGADTTPVKR